MAGKIGVFCWGSALSKLDLVTESMTLCLLTTDSQEIFLLWADGLQGLSSARAQTWQLMIWTLAQAGNRASKSRHRLQRSEDPFACLMASPKAVEHALLSLCLPLLFTQITHDFAMRSRSLSCSIGHVSLSVLYDAHANLTLFSYRKMAMLLIRNLDEAYCCLHMAYQSTMTHFCNCSACRVVILWSRWPRATYCSTLVSSMLFLQRGPLCPQRLVRSCGAHALALHQPAFSSKEDNLASVGSLPAPLRNGAWSHPP